MSIAAFNITPESSRFDFTEKHLNGKSYCYIYLIYPSLILFEDELEDDGMRSS